MLTKRQTRILLDTIKGMNIVDSHVIRREILADVGYRGLLSCDIMRDDTGLSTNVLCGRKAVAVLDSNSKIYQPSACCEIHLEWFKRKRIDGNFADWIIREEFYDITEIQTSSPHSRLIEV